MYLFDWEEPWQVYVLENLLIAKKLYDRGFEEARKLDPEFSNFGIVAEILFGAENVSNDEFSPEYTSEQALLLLATEGEMDEETEEKLNNLTEFVEGFFHYKVEIRIPCLERLWPNQIKVIEKEFIECTITMKGWEKDSDFYDPYPYWNILAGAGWLEECGKKIGICLHTVSNNYDDSDPQKERWLNELLIKVWDSVRVARAFSLRRKPLFKRLILFSGGNGDAQNRHGEAILRLKGNAGVKARLRRRNRALAKDANRAYDA